MTELDEASQEWDEAAAGAAFLEQANAVFTGMVQEVGPDPSHASGYIPAFQYLLLNVTSVERGDLNDNESIDLDVLIVSGAPYVSVNEYGVPSLDPSICYQGAELRAYATWDEGRWRLAYSDG